MRVHRTSFRYLAALVPVVLTAALSTGCASLPDTRTETVDLRRVEFALRGHGDPPVVFENGLAGTLRWWAEVLPMIAGEHTAFAYNRPGYGSSEPVATPRDGDHIVDELRALLRSKGLQPPYVLVGHSLGGLYMQLFARRHPHEVAALILVDSTHPEQFRGQGSSNHWPLWFRGLYRLLTTDVEKAEFDAVDATGRRVLALPPPAGKPVFVLSALKPMTVKSAFAKDANAKRQDVARLYPGSRQIWVDSGHGIPLERPDAVIDAIREALRLVHAEPAAHTAPSRDAVAKRPAP